MAREIFVDASAWYPIALRMHPDHEALADMLREPWLVRYRDHRFSLADAVSFTVMADRGIGEALTLDRHFAAAGFMMVPQRRSK